MPFNTSPRLAENSGEDALNYYHYPRMMTTSALNPSKTQLYRSTCHTRRTRAGKKEGRKKKRSGEKPLMELMHSLLFIPTCGVLAMYLHKARGASRRAFSRSRVLLIYLLRFKIHQGALLLEGIYIFFSPLFSWVNPRGGTFSWCTWAPAPARAACIICHAEAPTSLSGVCVIILFFHLAYGSRRK